MSGLLLRVAVILLVVALLWHLGTTRWCYQTEDVFLTPDAHAAPAEVSPTAPCWMFRYGLIPRWLWRKA